MTISGYSSAIVDAMLGWLKGLANWVLRLFNLAGSVGGSPLLWLSENWLKLLVFLIILGLGLDLLVWLIRWRPYWVWFRKERVIINDDRFFADADLDSDEDEWEDGVLAGNWDEHNYVVRSNQVRRQNVESGPQRTVVNTHHSRTPQSNLKKAPRPATSSRPSTASRSAQTVVKRPAQRRPVAQRPVKKRDDVFDDNLFDVDTNKPNAFDFYEDEVFNVANLPISDEFQDEDWQR